ncbi:unnamed protein product [Rotaria sp. Silwood2]|nr:unnamed protein product [Rotaria sp. Silwood2]CAF4153447.1 unnamed protein product [Rotaria sp. Silwood2]
MAINNKYLKDIDLDHDWKCYCQQSNDKTDIKTIISNANSINTNQRWSSTKLPHITTDIVDDDRRPCKWWYCKKIDWALNNHTSELETYLEFELPNKHDKISNISVTIWFNGTEIFSGCLPLLRNPIKLCSKLLSNENNHENILVICCANTKFTLHPHIRLYGKVIYAMGQVITHENNLNEYKDSNRNGNDILDYKVNVDDVDGRIDITFNPKPKSESLFIPSSPLEQSGQSINHDNETNEVNNLDNDLLVPRLTILILVVGTRGDVQPFIALGQALRVNGHRVRLATHEIFRSFVHDNGLEFYPLAGDPADLMSFMVKNAGIIPSLDSIVKGDVKKQRHSVAKILVSTWEACIKNDDETGAPFQAEAIIANPPSFGHIHCAEKLKIPLHMMFTMPWSPTTAFPHPLSNVKNSIGSRHKINLYSYDVIEMLTWTGIGRIVNNFRTKILGLRELHTRQAIHALIGERVPHTYCWSPSLVEKPNDWGSHINVSGFFFLNLGIAYTNPPTDLLEFLGIDRDGNQHDPKLSLPIYIGFGSITGHDSRRIFQIVCDALNETGYRAVLSGLAMDTDQLPSTIFKIGDVPHDWLFQYVSAVCHHGGAGTTAAGLRAGKPTIIVPFFGDQFFWGDVIEKNGAGPCPLPGKSITATLLAEAFRFVHQPAARTAAERIRDAILKEDGCAAAVQAFHSNLPLRKLHGDLEPTFAACYHVNKYNLQISRPVAQVLVAADALEESELHHHATREWQFMHDNRMHLLTHGLVEHSQKALSSIFINTAEDLKRVVNKKNDHTTIRILEGAGSVAKGVCLGCGHLTIGCLSLYGELTDGLNWATSIYYPHSEFKLRQQHHVTDFKSGAKAAGLSLWNGWKGGVTGIIKQPRAGYERHGVLGGAAGSLMATVNIAMKPVASILASVTWLSRGTYAGVRNVVEAYRNEGRRISTNLVNAASSTKFDGQYEENDDEEISAATQKAATRSGFHPKVCQYILHELEKIKIEREQTMAPSPKKKSNITNFFSKTE